MVAQLFLAVQSWKNGGRIHTLCEGEIAELLPQTLGKNGQKYHSTDDDCYMKNICYNNILHIRSAGKCIDVGIFWAWKYFDWIIKQLLDEAEYDMTNYADRSINTMIIHNDEVLTPRLVGRTKNVHISDTYHCKELNTRLIIFNV